MMLEDSGWNRGGMVGDILVCDFCVFIETFVFKILTRIVDMPCTILIELTTRSNLELQYIWAYE